MRGGLDQRADLRHWRRSILSFALASETVCHCMFLGSSAPPAQSGTTWSMIQPGQPPRGWPVAGHGCSRLNSALAAALRWIFASATVAKINKPTTTKAIRRTMANVLPRHGHQAQSCRLGQGRIDKSLAYTRRIHSGILLCRRSWSNFHLVCSPT